MTFIIWIGFILQIDEPIYDPQEYANNALVFRQPIGLKPSERRQFYDDERNRQSKLREDQ